jgi:hypothetical protein
MRRDHPADWRADDHVVNYQEIQMNKIVAMANELYEKEVLNAPPNEKVGIRGFSHVQIMDGDKIVGDSLWNENTVTNLGFNQYLVSSLGSIAGAKYVSHVGLGTGAGPAAADTALGSEVGTRQAVTAATSSGSKTARFTATFAAGWHSSAGAFNISSIGLYNTVSGGTCFSGNTFASSSCASNQAVNVTYDIVFA